MNATVSLIFTEVVYGLVVLIAIFVLHAFVTAKDGILRKIMIAYFVVEIWVFTGSGVWIWLSIAGRHVWPVGIFAPLLILPKVVVKIWLWWWLKKGRFKNNNGIANFK